MIVGTVVRLYNPNFAFGYGAEAIVMNAIENEAGKLEVAVFFNGKFALNEKQIADLTADQYPPAPLGTGHILKILCEKKWMVLVPVTGEAVIMRMLKSAKETNS